MTSARNERGIAMVTVLLIAMVLTVVSSVAAFSAIRELRSSTHDRRGTEALAYAEAGIDRFLYYLRVENVTWANLIAAGCENPAGLTIPAGVIGNGTFSATMKVYEPTPPSGNPADRVAPGACAYRATSASDPQGQFFIITAQGNQTAAKRTIQQVVKIHPMGLPVGIYAPTIDAAGTPNMSGISMFTEGRIIGREKLIFNGTDPYYYFDDVFPGGVSGRNPADHVPAAAHALEGIYLKQNGTGPEFPGPTAPTTRNCTANPNAQSLWDSDGSPGSGNVTAGCTGQSGYPLSSKFTPAIMDRVRPRSLTEQDHETLREAAKKNGIYCMIGATASCSMMGQQMSGVPATWQPADIQPLFTAGRNNFVAYFDFTTGTPLANQIKWQADVWGCNATNPALSRSAVLVVRRGGLAFNSAKVNGAFIMDGELTYSGSPTLNGSIISQSSFRISGNATFTMDECWVNNMPGVFLAASPISWAELDR